MVMFGGLYLLIPTITIAPPQVSGLGLGLGRGGGRAVEHDHMMHTDPHRLLYRLAAAVLNAEQQCSLWQL